MRGVLFDTSAYAALRRGHPGIARRFGSAERIYLNAIVLGELRAGFRKGNRPEGNEKELQVFLDSPRVDLLTVGDETSACYGEIFDGLRVRGEPIPINDIWIAASAMEHGLRLLTLDAHYKRVPQVIVDSVES